MAKRVVAVAGDVVELPEGQLYVNGKERQECYVANARRDSSSRRAHTVAREHYFVLGDSRRSSEDSRAWGDVSRRHIRGKIVFRLWPLWRSRSAQDHGSNDWC